MTLTILIALMSAFREAQADESVMLSLLLSSFTGVRGIRILRTSPFGVSAKFAYTEFYEVALKNSLGIHRLLVIRRA
jgi:hypothetical protein